jgi:GNAT superfamily N-acetyltransferase
MRLHVNNLTVVMRAGTAADLPLLLAFIQQMADFERLPMTATAESLREALFGETPAAHFLLAFVGETPIAYVTYFFTFATMVGQRGLWLDDVFVLPEFRGRGVGQALMAHLAEIARQHHCARFEWMVLDWNEAAINFYQRLGATVLPQWRLCRVDGEALAHLAQK